ncbi:MAG: copper amine oxidase N-terminal domain-containing protein [Clostridia bacterium]|nr:copper amine oxidase N-terminal domain-containing protein [Clostridia bacterium]
MKKFISLLILLSVLVSVFSASAQNVTVTENSGIYFSFDGNDTICFDEVTNQYLYPISYRDRTYVPLRFLCDFTGIAVEWIEETKTVALSDGGKKASNYTKPEGNGKVTEIEVNIDQEVNFTWNGERFDIIDPANNLPVYAIMYNDRTFIPARFIAQKAGFEVGWEEESQKITITSPKMPQQETNVPAINEPCETQPYNVMVEFSVDTLEWIENTLGLDPDEIFNKNFFTYYEKMQNGEKVPDSFYKLIISLNISMDYSEHFLRAAVENSNGYTNAFGKIIVLHSNPGEEVSDSMANVTSHYSEIDKMAGYEDVFKVTAMSEGSFAEPYFTDGRGGIMLYESSVINYCNENIIK